MNRFVVFIFLSISMPCFAQLHLADSLHLLRTVEIQGSRLSQFAPGIHTEMIDSSLLQIHQTSSVATLLSENTSAQVRSYGTGGLATLSFRGVQTTQSGVFWNGFNLNQPNLGMTDLSEIPAVLFNEITIQNGGASALFGSGTIGGSLQMGNANAFATPFNCTFSLSGGSFNDYTLAARASAGGSRKSWTSAFFGNSDRNNFKYKTLGDSIIKLEHAWSSAAGTIQQIAYRLSNKQTVSGAIWWQHTDRQLPATLVMASSDQRQVDDALRSTIQWLLVTERQKIQLRAGWFTENQHYTSQKTLSDKQYLLKTLSSEAEYKYSKGPISMEAGAAYRWITADITDYKAKQSRKEGALFSSLAYNWRNSGWKSVINLRQELNEEYHIPFCPAIGSEGPVSKRLRIRASISKNFRVPTMNDRFWQPGGNPDLKPESSWNQEAGLDWSIKEPITPFDFSLSATGYTILINNLILWEPETTSIWSPVNIQQVWSRGIESVFKVAYSKEKINATLRISYNYSPSTYRLSGNSTDVSAGKQMIYIPVHKFNSTLNLSMVRTYGMLSFNVNGKRFVQKDNQKYLPSFALINATIGQKIMYRNISGRLQAEVRNLLNRQYQVVQYYPEPGISIELSLTLTITKPHNN